MAVGNGEVVMDLSEVPFQVEVDEDCGRYLVAKKDLSQGDLILSEKPTIHGLSRESQIVCFGCYNDVDEEDPESCDFCGLPVCGDQCQSAEQHLPECQAFQSSGGRHLSSTLLDQPEFLHEVVLVLRCLALRQKNMMDWMNLTELESHMEMREGSELEERSTKVGQWICRHLNNLDVDVDTIKEICAILDVNSFEVPHSRSSANIQAVYSTAGCLVEHDCVPTSHKSFGEDLDLNLRAAIDIKKDQHISISYTDSLWPTVERRNHLMITKYFECICLRCCDPKELNTYLSAIKCMKCAVGYLLPEDPLESSSDWKCEDCSNKVPAEFIENVNNQVAETIQLLELSGLEPEKCEKFLTVHLRILHPQHAHMLDVKHSLLHLLGHHEGYLMADLSEQLLQMKEEIGRSLLQVADRLIPGLSRLRGTTLYELFLTHQQRGLNWTNPSNRKSPKDVLSAFKVAEDYLSQCIRTLQFEPAHQAEGKLRLQAEQEYESLKEYVAKIILSP